jgi:hypothetical protein
MTWLLRGRFEGEVEDEGEEGPARAEPKQV